MQHFDNPFSHFMPRMLMRALDGSINMEGKLTPSLMAVVTCRAGCRQVTVSTRNGSNSRDSARPMSAPDVHALLEALHRYLANPTGWRTLIESMQDCLREAISNESNTPR